VASLMHVKTVGLSHSLNRANAHDLASGLWFAASVGRYVYRKDAGLPTDGLKRPTASRTKLGS